MRNGHLNRREFLKGAACGGAALSLAPLFSFAGGIPSRKGAVVEGRKLNVACVGVGGRGHANVQGVSGENIVALCDVDRERARGVFDQYPDVPKYRDFRQMLVELDEQIDAVVVSTPDHMHFPVAMMAVTMGKHVYVEKPLTHTVEEARLLTLAAKEHGVVTQMGNQGHAGEGIRLAREWVQAGVIGAVREVHVWTNRPIWPQGIDRPAGVDGVPDSLDWNRWLGVAPQRPFNKAYLPFNWRGWWDFGCGALGDMACHIMDAAHWALDLNHPTRVSAETSGVNRETAPTSAVVTYEFPARGSMPPVTLKWYEGSRRPERPKDLEADRPFDSAGGLLMVGDRGSIMDLTDYCSSPRIIPESRMREVQANEKPEKTIPRVPGGNQHAEWINACKGGGPLPGSRFENSGPLTEVVLLGNLAMRTGKALDWDGERLISPSVPEANLYVSKKYRVF